VREKISHIHATGKEAMEKAAAPTWLKLVRAIDRFHASSVWSDVLKLEEGYGILEYVQRYELSREEQELAFRRRTVRSPATIGKKTFRAPDGYCSLRSPVYRAFSACRGRGWRCRERDMPATCVVNTL
jgi:hypothetical protein